MLLKSFERFIHQIKTLLARKQEYFLHFLRKTSSNKVDQSVGLPPSPHCAKMPTQLMKTVTSV